MFDPLGIDVLNAGLVLSGGCQLSKAQRESLLGIHWLKLQMQRETFLPSSGTNLANPALIPAA